MGALTINRHAVGAAAVCVLVLLLACRLGGSGAVSASAPSAAPRADIDEVATPGDVAFPADGPSIGAAREIAERHWGGPACNGNVTIAWATLDPGTNATASWRNPTDAWNNAGANFDCRIDFNVHADFDWPKLCTVMAHEVGHLLGKQHAADTADLMAPVYNGALPACEQASDPAHPVAPVGPASVVELQVDDEEIEAIAAPSKKKIARGRVAARRRAAAIARCRTGRRTLVQRRRGRPSGKHLRCSLPRAGRRTLLRAYIA